VNSPFIQAGSAKKKRRARSPRKKSKPSGLEMLASKLNSPTLRRDKKISIIRKLEGLLEEELEKMEVVKSKFARGSSDESHKVFIYLKDKGWKLGAMNCISGFKINGEDENLLEVREGDIVKLLVVKPEECTGVKKFL
jgi:hypothetical protein